jgi:pyrimidine operon attenuation protein/uracil phosphoribosyltransferase
LVAVATSKTIGPAGVEAAVEQLASAIAQNHATSPALMLLGVANGGVTLAAELARRLRHPRRHVSVGTIDISFHRDDIGRHPIPKEFQPTHIPRDIHGATVILVDDVLFSGRTIKAALDELFDHGRPATVELAVLVDRGGHRLPIAANYVGIKLEATETEKVVVALDPARTRGWSIRVLPHSSRP